MLNTAVVTPMPSAKATTASIETNRARTTVRAATLRSAASRDIAPRRWLDGVDRLRVGRHLPVLLDWPPMPKLAANLTMLFGEVDFLDRFEAAARARFRGVEFLFPYPFPAEELKRRLHDHQLELVLHNLPAGNWAAGERGIACLPDRVDEFKAGVDLAIEYAQ